MLSAFLLCTALSTAQVQGDKLEVTQPRPTYGHLGAARPAGKGILPGDIAHFAFDIKNLKFDESGRASYSIAIEVLDSAGKVFFKQEPYNSIAQNYFGGNSMPCAASLEIPPNAKPGTYSWTVTIHDRAADKTATLKGKGEVLKADFGVVRVGTFADPEARVPVAPIGTVGNTLFVNFAAVGFSRNPKTKQPDLAVEMKIKDENGKVTTANPIAGQFKSDVPEAAKVLPIHYGLTLNRPGRYTIELTARCELCGKSATVTLPVHILPME